MDGAEVQICSVIVLIVFSLLADLNTYPLQTLVETFVRADGAFIPFAGDFNMNNVTTTVKGVGEVGDVHVIDLQAPINSLIGRQVVKVGRSSGLTTGTIMAYALEYNDEKGICFFTDFLVVGENQQTFDLEGDSGSLILLKGQDCEKPQPVGIIWGGTANRGRLKLKVGLPPENWTSGVDLGRLLDLLELDLITTNDGLQGLCFQFNPIFFSFYINALIFQNSFVFFPSYMEGVLPKSRYYSNKWYACFVSDGNCWLTFPDFY